MENIIFLDIDGVLNNIKVKFNEESVTVIKELIQRYNAKVVMITSWQINGTEARRKYIQQQFEKLGIYQIEFYELSDNDYALSFFENNKNIFEDSKTSNSTETSVNMGNNNKYTLTTNGKFKVVSRIDNTFIYLKVDESYKSSVQEILKELGY